MYCIQGKVYYSSSHKAYIALERTQGQKRRSHKTVKEGHTYHCRHCGGYHITSEPKEDSVKLRSMHTKIKNQLKRRRQYDELQA